MENMSKTLLVQTLGCKLNFSETAALVARFEAAGYRSVRAGQADVCLINTCSVTETSDQKDRQAIHRIVREHPEAFVVVTGCYAQLKPLEVAAIPGVDLVLGADFKFDAPSHVRPVKNGHAEVLVNAHQEIVRFLPACARGDRTRFFLKVQDGCDNFCTYCTVPFARGRSRNPSVASLVRQAEEAVAAGAKEIVLSGVNIGSFGKRPSVDTGANESLMDLLRGLDALPGDVRYRISSLEPDSLTGEMIDFVAASRHFMPHFHLPLQSGDDEVLALMHRHYRRDLFAERLDLIKAAMPDAFIGVDVIVGMRGETPERFENSCRFLEGLPLSQLHVFSYSERPGTKALEIPYRVTGSDKKRRSEVLHRLSEEKRRAFYASQSGRTLRVLFEHGKQADVMSGFSENYVRVEVPWRKEWVNEVVTVRTGAFNADASALVGTPSTD